MTNIAHHITARNAATALAGVFALVSVQNVAHFFIDLQHPASASWTLGIAIGVALVVMAHLLAGTDTRDRKPFLGLLSVTLILVALSGIIQGAEYEPSLGWLGYVLAFTLAATGEIVLPLAVGWHDESQRRRIVNDAGAKVEQMAAQTLVDVMGGVDISRAQEQAEQRIESLVIAHVDSVVSDLMPSGNKLQPMAIAPQSPQVQSENFAAIAPDGNKAIPAEKRRKLQLQLRSNGIIATGELSERMGEGSPKISKDKAWLLERNYIDENGKVTDAGMQWFDGESIAKELPQVAVIEFNGRH